MWNSSKKGRAGCTGTWSKALPRNNRSISTLRTAVQKARRINTSWITPRLFGVRGTVFRQSCIYGPHQFGIEDQGWVAWFTIAALLGYPVTIYGNGKQVRDLLYIDDLIDAYWKAVDRIDVAVGQAYNVGGSAFRLSLLQFLDLLEAHLGTKIPVTLAEARQGDQKVFVCDVRKAKQQLDWAPRTYVDAGVRSLIQWITANKHLFVT